MRAFGIVLVVVLLPAIGSAQSLRETTLPSLGPGKTLEEIFREIERQTSFRFTYDVAEVPLSATLSGGTPSGNLLQVLRGLAREFSLVFTQIDNQLVVRRSAGDPGESVRESGTIRGRVIDRTSGSPLVGANVLLQGTSRGASADENGRFSITNVNSGEYTLLARYVGYLSRSEVATVTGGEVTEISIGLDQSMITVDEVVQTGTFSQREKKEMANPITVLPMSTIRQAMPAVTNLTDILSTNVPGYFDDATSGFNFASTTNPIIRGSSSSSGKQLVIYIDGIPVSNESYKQSSPYTAVAINGTPPVSQQQDINKLVNLNDVERIEVLRGPMASTLYGSGAGNGVINIITKKSSVNRTRASLLLTRSSVSDIYSDGDPTKSNQVLTLAGGSGQVGYNLGLSRLTRDYTYQPTAIPAYVSWSGNAGTKLNLEAVLVDTRFDYMATTSGAQSVSKMWQKYAEERGWDSVPSPSAANWKMDNKTFNASMILKHMIMPNWFHSVLFGYNSYQQDQYDFAAPSSANRWRVSTTTMAKNSVRYFSNYFTPLFDDLKFDVTAGFEYWRSNYDNATLYTAKPYDGQLAGQTILNVPGSTRTYRRDENWGYFAETVIGYAGRAFLTAGGRMERSSNITANGGKTLAPRAGLSYVQQFDEVTVKPRFSIGSTVTPPRWEQVVGVVSSSVTVLPNNSLRAEKNAGYEVGADLFYADLATMELTYYSQVASDLIFLETLPTTPGQPAQQQYINIGRVTNKGFEVTGSIALTPFQVRFTYTALDNRYGAGYVGYNEGERVLNSPRIIANASVAYMLPDVFSLTSKPSSLSVQVHHRGTMRTTEQLLYYYDEQFRPDHPVAPSPTPIIDAGSYTLLNASMTYWVTDVARVLFELRNIANTQVVRGLLYPLVGREITAGVALEF
jgi:outer membrane receptor protein involved in Fe transport